MYVHTYVVAIFFLARLHGLHSGIVSAFHQGDCVKQKVMRSNPSRVYVRWLLVGYSVFSEFQVAEYLVTERHISELNGIGIFPDDILPNRQIVEFLKPIGLTIVLDLT
jgi:hypothetical protein